MKLWNADFRPRTGGLDRLRLWAWRIVSVAMLSSPAASWAQTAPPAAETPPPAPPPPLELPAASPVMPSQSPLGPTDLTPWGMYLNADPVVKAVLIGLLFASVLTWTIWLAKTVEIMAARRRVRAALRVLSHARTTPEAAERLAKRNTEVRRFVEAAATELSLSADVVETDGIKERVASRLERLEAGFTRRINRGTGLLATIGATAPFVGLAEPSGAS